VSECLSKSCTAYREHVLHACRRDVESVHVDCCSARVAVTSSADVNNSSGHGTADGTIQRRFVICVPVESPTRVLAETVIITEAHVRNLNTRTSARVRSDLIDAGYGLVDVPCSVTPHDSHSVDCNVLRNTIVCAAYDARHCCTVPGLCTRTPIGIRWRINSVQPAAITICGSVRILVIIYGVIKH